MKCDIQLDAPNIGELEKKYLAKAIDIGYVSTQGPFVPQFENIFARYIKSRNTAATQSGTSALHMALYELGIGKGDEVILPALTFVASANPVLYVGANPVFVDVTLRNWTIDPDEIVKKISKRTKAIMPVHFYGNPCDMAAIMAVAKKYGLCVIEDATESLGAKIYDKFTGTIGDMGCFSFNGNKVITTGGGGMVAGRDRKKIGHIRFLINQARDGGKYFHPELGFNHRMTNIEAALGLAQMQKLDGFLKTKRKFHDIYTRVLNDLDEISFQEQYDDAVPSWWMTCVSFKSEHIFKVVQSKLSAIGIPTRRIFQPLTDFPYFKRCRRTGCRNSYRIYQTGLCLPGSTLNRDGDIYFVAENIKKILKGL